MAALLPSTTPRYNPATPCPGVASVARCSWVFLGLGADSRVFTANGNEV